MKNIFIILIAALMLTGCKENQDITQFDLEQRMIYFGSSTYDDGLPPYDTTMNYTFAMDELGLTKKRLAIPVRVMGTSPTEDLPYTVSIIDSLSKIKASDVKIEPAIFHAGLFVDTLYVVVNKTEQMADQVLHFTLEVQENAHFKKGLGDNVKLKVNVSDMLTKPTWWEKFRAYFGPYHKEVYQQWIQIYPLGVDPTPHIITGEPYLYWGRMPDDANFLANTYPVLYTHIRQLKQYFEDNVVHPGGDTSLPRIKLP